MHVPIILLIPRTGRGSERVTDVMEHCRLVAFLAGVTGTVSWTASWPRVGVWSVGSRTQTGASNRDHSAQPAESRLVMSTYRIEGTICCVYVQYWRAVTSTRFSTVLVHRISAVSTSDAVRLDGSGPSGWASRQWWLKPHPPLRHAYQGHGGSNGEG